MSEALIADDHLMVRQRLQQFLEETDDILVIAEAGNGAEALNTVLENEVDVVLLDIVMPGQIGVEILREVKLVKPGIRVLILRIYAEDQYAARVIKDGVAGYLTKVSAPEELVNAIHKVARDGKYVSVALAEKLALDLEEDNEASLHEALPPKVTVVTTEKMREVMDHICKLLPTV